MVVDEERQPIDAPHDPSPPSKGVGTKGGGNLGGRNVEVDFRGQTRTNVAHASTTDPKARLYRKGPGGFDVFSLEARRDGAF